MQNLSILIDTLKVWGKKLPGGLPPAIFKLHPAWILLRNMLKGERRRRWMQQQLGLQIPPVCIFSVTQRCNLNCLGCFTKNYRQDKALTPEEIAQVITRVKALGTYTFIITGGEPLLLPGILSLLGQHRDCNFFFFTNGTLLGEKEIYALKRYKQIVPVLSLEGDADQTDSRRGEGVWARLVQTRRLLKRAHIPFGCSLMVTHRNLATVTLRDYWERLRRQGVVFGLLLDYVPFPFNNNPAFILTPDDIRYKKMMLTQRRRDTKLPLFTFPLDGCFPALYSPLSPTPLSFSCGAAGAVFFHINPGGYAEPCPFCHYARDNMLYKAYPAILQSAFFRQLRTILSRQQTLMPAYHTCQCVHEAGACARQTEADSTEKPLVKPIYIFGSSRKQTLAAPA
jgi:MoaA/NifB/PqqE/SkfB family radical SAM enzyme